MRWRRPIWRVEAIPAAMARAKTPFPLALKNNQAVETDTGRQETEQLEQETQRLMTEADSDATHVPG